MPTGYTAEVQSGEVTDFRTFALRCARAFGATIMQREEPLNVLPKPRQASDFYTESLDKARAEQARLTAPGWNDAESEAEAEADYQRRLKSYRQTISDMAEHQDRYNAMLVKVQGWNPPTKDHQALKKFMVEQLVDSRKFDTFDFPEPVKLTGTEWLQQARAKAAKEVAYQEKALREEEQRVVQANRWIRELYDSLPPAEETVPA